MSSIFTADTSTQGTGGTTNTKTYNTKDNPNIRFFSKSGIYNSSENNIKFFTNNTDALTIDNNQKVICDGSLITNLTYNNITGRPTLATVATSGLYNDLSGRPSLATVATSGLYNDLSGRPSLATVATSGLYNDLSGRPSLATVATSGLYNDLSGRPSLSTVATSGNYNDLTNQTFINSSTNIYNNNTGNVGIGITNPTSKLHINGNIKVDNSFNTEVFDFGNLILNKRPWGLYFAENYDSSLNIIRDVSGNNRHATTSGTLTKTTASGNGATGAITYLTGNTSSSINFGTGSIPTAFTILGLTRYNAGTRARILQATSVNWLLGHVSSTRGLAYFVNSYYTDGSGITGSADDWLTSIAKSSGSIPNNILMNGIAKGATTANTTGGYNLTINSGSIGQFSDFAFSAVMIWDTALTDAEMTLLNTTINNYKTSGDSLQNLFNKINILSDLYTKEIFKDNTNISNIFVTSNVIQNSTNLINYNNLTNKPTLFTQNDASNIFVTSNVHSNTSNFLVNYNNLINKTFINSGNDIYYNGGNVGIGTVNPIYKLDIKNGNINNEYGFSTNDNSIYSFLTTKKPWGMYFAEDWSGSTLLDSSGNNRHATTTGTITKTTASGNGASGPITYISGGTSATITWSTGSIPSTFTILSLTRYNGGTRRRILYASINNWLHGHWNGRRGVVHYDAWNTSDTSVGNLDDWVCCIGKNSGTVAVNTILIDGVASGTRTTGTGNYTLTINNGPTTSEYGDWALSTVMIWDTALTDAEMVNLNTMINQYKLSGIPIRNEFKNLNIYADTYINANLIVNYGNIGIGSTIPVYKLDVAGDVNVTGNFKVNGNNLSTSSSQWTTLGTSIFYNGGNVGIGNNNPLYKLSVNGAGEFISDNGNKLIFSYIANAYKHRIYTQHNSGADSGNHFDFYTWRAGQGVNDEGDRHCLRLSATHTHFPSSTNKYFWINNENSIITGYDHTTAPLTLFHKTPTSASVLNDSLPILNLAREGTGGQAWGARANFNICRWEHSSVNSRTRLDLNLAHDAYDNINIMTFRSDGRVGINTTNPTSRFTIRGDYSVIDNNFCLDASDGTVNNKYNFKIYPYVIGAGQVGYKFRVVNNTSTTTDFLTIDHNGNVGIGNVTPSYKFQIEDGSCFLGDSAYSSSATGTPNGYRLILDNTYNGTAGSGTNCNKLLLHNTASFNGGFGIEQGAVTYQSGDSHSFYTGTTQSSYGTRRMLLSSAGNLNINANNNAYTRLNVTGVASINGGNVYGAYNNQLLAGALCIGDTTTNYGGGNNWTTNTAGLLMECLNNTEIVILDSAEYLISVIYYVGSTSKYLEYGRNMGYGHPNAHYFRCNNIFECYFANGAGGWNYFKVEPTSLWGDGLSTASDQAGTKYLTIRNIMLQNPHIVPASVGATASIRLGRAGGVQSGTWYEIGTRSDGVFHIVKEADSKFGINLSSSGDVGIYNSAPVNFTYGPNLHLGRCQGGYISNAKVTIVKDNNNGSVRQNIIGWDNNFYYVFCGDGGGANNNSYWSQQCYVYYSAPASCFYINSGGYVTMPYSYGTSDQRIKSDIKTIDNALFKVLNLRGIEYTDIREGCRHIGLIAQEVEGVIPEVVHTDEHTEIKSIAYGNMAGLFVNAIKELNEIILKQNEKINNLMERIEVLENGYK